MLLKYVMLIIFPPVGIPLYIRDRYGPSKKKRAVVCLISALWFAFLVFLISRPPIEKHKATVKTRSDIFKTEKIETNKVAYLKKAPFRSASSTEKVSMIANALGSNIDGAYASVLFDDGTGIEFPSANINLTAMYGKMRKDGTVTKQLGTVLIKSGTTFRYTPFSTERILEDDLVSAFPGDYSSDSSDVSVARVGKNAVTVLFTIYDNSNDESTIQQAFQKALEDKEFISDLVSAKRYVESASVSCVTDDTDSSGNIVTGDDGNPKETETRRFSIAVTGSTASKARFIK